MLIMNLSRSKKLQTKARRTSKTEVENKVLEQADSLEKMELEASERRWLMASPAVPHVLMRQADFFQISVIRLTKPSNTSMDASRTSRYFSKVDLYRSRTYLPDEAGA